MNESDGSEGTTRRRVLNLGMALAGVIGTSALTAGSEALADPEPFVPDYTHDQPTIPRIPASFRSPPLRPYADALPVLPTRRLGGEVVIAQRQHRFHRDLPDTASWGFAGVSHLGPTFEAEVGESVETVFTNSLPRHVFAEDIDLTLHGVSPEDRSRPPVSVHLHGAPNAPEDDGHPMAAFRPGQRRGYRFGLGSEATALWYHDHTMGTTRLSVYAGLAGHFLVRDEWDTGRADNPLKLPAEEHEVPLVITDKLFGDGWFAPLGTLWYQGTPTLPRDHWAGGLCGDVIVVNGKAWPYLEVDRSVYRFRLVNAAQLNDYRLHLSNGAAFWVIGGDGGLLDGPVLVKELDIAAGERYDILIDFAGMQPGETVELRNKMQIAMAGQLIGATMVPNVMRFVARAGRGPVRVVPKTLRRKGGPAPLPAIPKPTVPTRTVTLNVTIDPSVPPNFISSGVMNINNLRFRDPDFDRPRQGTIEQWDIVNSDFLYEVHDLHLHLVRFRVLGRQDYDIANYLRSNPSGFIGQRWTPSVDGFTTGPVRPPAPYEAGWKDTVRCPPNQVTRILVRWPTARELGFDPDRPFAAHSGGTEQGYVFHCHLLDHEDHEMMLRLRVVSGDGSGQAAVTPHPPPTHGH